MAVVANQAEAFDKSMLMACPHLGDVLRPGLILDHGLTGSYSESEGPLGHSGLLSLVCSRNRKSEVVLHIDGNGVDQAQTKEKRPLRWL